MELVDFYRLLLPATGSYCLWFKGTKQHVWANSLEELTTNTIRTNKRADWYFGTAAFDGEKKRKQVNVTGKRCFYLDLDAGEEKIEKIKRRIAEGRATEAELKTVYVTQRDAIADVVRFAKEAALPPTLIVSSGAGVHVYWALDADMAEPDWLSMAHALGRMTKSAGMRVDPTSTIDAARVLRPVGGLHSNGNRVTVLKNTGKVWGVDELRAKLPMVEEEQFALTAPKRAKMDVNADLPMFESAPVSAFKVAEKCGALRAVALAKGDVTEPLWRAMIGLVKHTVEGADVAHEWSAGHPDYDHRETQVKFDRYEAGPITCETFGRYSDACATCEHAGKVKSPIQLGRMTVEQVAALPEEKRPAPAPPPKAPEGIPFDTSHVGEGYRAVESGPKRYALEAMLVTYEKDEEGGTIENKRWVRISDEVFWLHDWSEAGQVDGDSAMTRLNLYSNAARAVRSWAMPTRALATAQDLFKLLGERSITRANVSPQVTTLMHNYVNSQFSKVRALAPRYAVRTRFGLQFDSPHEDARLVCALGRYIIRGNGEIEDAVMGSAVVRDRDALTIKPLPANDAGRWGPEVWKSIIRPGAKAHVDFLKKYYTRPGYEIAQIATMLALSSPLMVFSADTQITPGAALPQGGLTVSLYSRSSGQGKTSMQKVIASAYGDPSVLVRSGARTDATLASQSSFAGILGTMPLFLDEVTGNTPAEVADLVNRISMGADKQRSDSGGTHKHTKTWALVGMVSSNIPQREMLAARQSQSDAQQMRLLEINCEFPPVTKDGHVEFERDRDVMISPNYGCLGAIISLAIVNAGPVMMRERVQTAFGEAAKLMRGSTQRERFYQRGMACVLALHDILSSYGLAPFNRDDLVAQYRGLVAEALEYVATVRRAPDDLCRKMISDLAPHIIVTYGEGGSRLEAVRNSQHLRSPYLGRRIESLNRLYLLSDAIRDWAKENQASFGEIIKRARDAGYLAAVGGAPVGSSTRVTLTRGTDLATVHGSAYALNEELLFGESLAVPDNVVPIRKEGV